ncbi:hypothetical protein, partial [Secundilactobacillus malefermentans]|uniref:hypothetical protein n=1 Tax=Secundilactobacillus malefermentans TaxID=176292 RepID=UPI001F260968
STGKSIEPKFQEEFGGSRILFFRKFLANNAIFCGMMNSSLLYVCKEKGINYEYYLLSSAIFQRQSERQN